MQNWPQRSLAASSNDLIAYNRIDRELLAPYLIEYAAVGLKQSQVFLASYSPVVLVGYVFILPVPYAVIVPKGIFRVLYGGFEQVLEFFLFDISEFHRYTPFL